MNVLVIILAIALIIAICFAICYKTTATKYAESIANLTQHVASLESAYSESKKIISDLQENIKDYENRIVVLTDDLPDEDSPYNRAMKLTNEIAPYITKKNDRIQLSIFESEFDGEK